MVTMVQEISYGCHGSSSILQVSRSALEDSQGVMSMYFYGCHGTSGKVAMISIAIQGFNLRYPSYHEGRNMNHSGNFRPHLKLRIIMIVSFNLKGIRICSCHCSLHSLIPFLICLSNLSPFFSHGHDYNLLSPWNLT